MTKRKTAIAAAAVKASAGNAVFVLASRKDRVPGDEKQLSEALKSSSFSKFGCTACNTVMTARADTEPFCVTCGSGEDHVHVLEAKTKVAVEAKSDLVAIHCSTCDNMTMLELPVVKAIVASTKEDSIMVHCSSCGTAHSVKKSAVVSSTEDGTTNHTELKTPDMPKDPGDNFDDPAEPTKASDMMEDDVDLDDLETIESNLENFGDKKAEPFKKGDNKSSAQDLMIPTTPEDPGTEIDADMVLEPFTLEEEDPFSGDVMADPFADDTLLMYDSPMVEEDFGFDEPEGDLLVDALELDDTDMALAFVKANGRVIAMKGQVAVASFNKKLAGKNAALANSPALPIAAATAVKHDGLRAGLQSLGFTLTRVPVGNKASVSRKVQEIQASMQQKKVQEEKEFASTFALAAAGLNRGNWRGHSNPLRQTLESRLANLGVQSPKRIASSILEEAGLEYAKTLLTVTSKLSKMSASARKEMSDMLELSQVTASSDESEEDTQDTSDIQARLTRPALLSPKITASTNSDQIPDVASILAGKAPLNFASI